MTLAANREEAPKTTISLSESHRGQTPRIIATASIGRFVDERAWRDGAPPAQVGPALPLLPGPVVMPLQENFGQPPKPGQRIVHLGMRVGDGVGPAPAEYEIHAPWDNEKTSGDGLLEHPAQCDLGEAALGLRVATADIAVNARKPDLLEVARAAVR